MRRSIVAIIFLIVAAAPVLGEGSHDLALRARKAGKIAPLTEILTEVSAQVPGSVLEVELKERATGYIYEVEILTPEGLVVEVEVDARSKRILGRHAESDEGD